MKTAFELFDKMVLPIILYGAEVWGHQRYDHVERVQLKFCKFLLGVGSKTNNSAVLGECGRKPLYFYSCNKCIKYWCKLLHMDVSRLPKSVYLMLKNLDSSGYITWVTYVKEILYKYGFGIVYVQQDIGDIDNFMNLFKQRLSDCCTQEWHADVTLSSRLSTYCTFKSLLEPEKYLYCINIRKYCVALAKFRCSNHKLQIEIGRHKNIETIDRICKFCSNQSTKVIEDEFHFMCVCPLYAEFRLRFLDKTIINNKTDFINLMKTQNPQILMNIALFIYHGVNARKFALDL